MRLNLTFLPLLATSAFASVQFTSPSAGGSVSGGTAINIQWKDDGAAPSISDLTTYQMWLCAGGNTDGTFINLVQITLQGAFAGGNSASGVVTPDAGAGSKNAYFIKMIAVAAAGGTTTIYSPRFTLTGMTGTFPDNIAQAAKAVTGTAGPANIPIAAAVNAGPPGAAQFDVPFGEQTGLTRWAPMMSIPPTKITRKDYKPLYPTSAFTIAKTFLPIATIATTITQSQTFSVQFRENQASPAPNPKDDMAKFLNRWKD